jgi:cytochrome P450
MTGEVLTPHVESSEARIVLDPWFKTHAPEEYAKLREQGPVHPVRFASGFNGWMVVDYELARQALTHPALLKDATPAAAALEAVGFVANQADVGVGGNMLEADPPQHTRLRKLVSGAFTPRRTAALEPRIAEITDALLDTLPPAGHTDLVTVLTTPLPVTIIAELLGIPPEHRDAFRTLSSSASLVGTSGHREALAGLHQLLGGLVADKRRSPEDDLLSALVTARDEEDGRLSESELIGTALLLIIAGHETTVNLIGNAVLALLRHPEQLRVLRETPELMPGAIEEFLRYDTSVEHTTLRFAAEDLRFGGQVIAKGDIVAVALASANRGAPLVPPRDPAVLDITAPAARHLAFGHGIHHCLGAPLARLEATVALRTLLRRTRHLELAVEPEELNWIPAGMMRGLLNLPVRYEMA